MAKIEDFLSKKQKAEIYDSVRKYILDLPNVSPNSWDAFFIIIFLVLVADKKVRPAEQAFFEILINALFNKDWESAKLIRGQIPSEGRQINLANKVFSIYETIRSLDEESIQEVVNSLAENITDDALKEICLLSISRLAISDLELARYEKKLITLFASSWNLSGLLKVIKFNKLREESDSSFIKSLLKGNAKILDNRGLSHEQYEETVHLIHEQGLNIPGDELVSEQFQLYRYQIDKKHASDIKDIRRENDLRNKERKEKYKQTMKDLNKKFRYNKNKYGPAFICRQFLTELNFHKDSFDNLDEKFENLDIWNYLSKLNSAQHIDDPRIRSKRIKARKDWLEISNIVTGRNSLGRIYYHESSDPRWLFHVYVDAKADNKSQRKAFKQTDSWKKNGFN